jgi:glyoxylase-like metal-dependent hydrolase (beta-lactamase superfamily II)
MEISPNVHLIPSRIVNVYLIFEPAGLTLIDTGLPGNFNTVMKYIAGLGKQPRDLKRIVITHSDGDHVGALAALKAATAARVYANPIEAQAIAAAHPSRELKMTGLPALLFNYIARPLFKAKPAQVDELINDGDVLPVLGGLRVVATIGHTPGHISLYAPAHRLLFAGDSMTSTKTGLRCSGGMNTWDEARAKEAVKIQAALGAEIVCVGHGPVVMNAVNKFPQV